MYNMAGRPDRSTVVPIDRTQEDGDEDYSGQVTTEPQVEEYV